MKNQIKKQANAYRQLFQGANSLLESTPLFWTERLLLRLVRYLSKRRLELLGEIAAFADEPKDVKRPVGFVKPPESKEDVPEFAEALATKIRQAAAERKEKTAKAVQENMLKAQVETAMQGHDLEQWEKVEEDNWRKWQAKCQNCGMSVYVSDKTLYSILEDECISEGQSR